MIYILVSAICAVVAVFTAFFALRGDRADKEAVAAEMIDKTTAALSGHAKAIRSPESDRAVKVYETPFDIHRTGQRTRGVTSIQDYVRLKGNEENGQSAEAAGEVRLG